MHVNSAEQDLSSNHRDPVHHRDGLGVSRRIQTSDGVSVRVETFPGDDQVTCDPVTDDLVFVVVPGFTQSSRVARVGRIVGRLQRHGAVIQLDLRGHGRSGGASTIGNDEVYDVDAAVGYARSLGYTRVVTIGFSLGAAVVLRQAALYGGVTAVAAVSGPGQWFYRGTAPMRTLHRAIGSHPGRTVLRFAKRTRVLNRAWPEPYPMDPAEAAAKIAAPVLVVHGDRDDYFPLHHAWRVHRAGPTSTLWVESGFGHAESHMTPTLTDRIAAWLDDASSRDAAQRDAAQRDGDQA